MGTPGCWGVEEGLEPLGGGKGLGPLGSEGLGVAGTLWVMGWVRRSWDPEAG